MKLHLTAVILLLIALAGISIYYDYPSMLSLQPQGSHMWRQADCMAMTQNYKQFHLPFFEPETYNLESTHGKVAGEFPIFYFIASKFENAGFALRLMHAIIFLLGIFAAYSVAFYFLERRLLSIFCCLMLFTSPLLVFYGNNFLSDVPSLSFAWMGWALFLHHYKREEVTWMLVAFTCFALSALLKASEALNLIIVFLFLYRSRIRTPRIKGFILFLYALLPVFLWYAYAKWYNAENHNTYYCLSSAPAWKLSLKDTGLGLWRMVVSWSKVYFWRPTSIALILSSYFLYKNRKRLSDELKAVILLSVMTTILYILFFYEKMISHEYYYAAFYIFVLFWIIGTVRVYNFFYAENVFSHTALFIFLLINIFYCKNFVKDKLTFETYNGYLSSEWMQQFLAQHGVDENKSVLVIPDCSPNEKLYQLKRKGFTDFNHAGDILKQKKADYLFADANSSTLKTYSFTPQDTIASFYGFYLYKLK